MYRWRADINEAGLSSLLRNPIGNVVAYSDFYDKEKGSFLHSKFIDFLSNNNITSANKFARKNKNDGGKDEQVVPDGRWNLKTGSSCKESVIPKRYGAAVQFRRSTSSASATWSSYPRARNEA